MMKTLLPALIAGSMAIPAAAAAQSLPSASVGVVDLNKLRSECTACQTALAQLQQQQQQLGQRRNELAAPLNTEGQAIQAEVQALNGKQPSQALQQRVQSLQQREAQANRELAQREQVLQRNAAYVRQQIDAQLSPALDAVMTRRKATVMIDVSQSLRHNPAVDLTNDVMAELNKRLTTLATVAPAPQQPAQQQTPQGR
ncbi:OmpH family outer membrane protein [Sphingomicrobium lutaoense]|uniref:Skp family chaperone for outer membrane proteins n=1 Tax=Sphingomicrobium lutaoense TaxID=515949 RepID=A0A839Z173_9SPHN|nr:OmpH family outer membrane protein [Sphingomicrobium lutaoense]MBB3763807.1 Skp family chaperone for outer membrane proteins [Sphingomicrobium lutaoense]